MITFPISPALRQARALQDLNLGLPVAVTGTDALLLPLERVSAEAFQVLHGLQVTFFAGRYNSEHGEHVVGFELADDFTSGQAERLTAEVSAGGAITGAEVLQRPELTAARELLRRAELLPAGFYAEGEHGFTGLASIDLTAADPRDTLASVTHLGAAVVPIAGSAHNQLHAFRADTDGIDHYALVIGADRPLPSGVRVRLHSECFTGDFLGSLKCDCGSQLQTAIARMVAAGQGILLYLRQEGRGIGLSNKIRAYALQDQGCDTVDANLRLGFGIEQRYFKTAALMLEHLEAREVRLLTNNPRKLDAIERYGIKVVGREPLAEGENPFNTDYLRTKRERTGHLL